MPKYGVLEISEEDLVVLRKLEKDLNIQPYLREIYNKTTPLEIQHALVKLMELQFEISTAEQTPEHINTAKGLSDALGIFISAISKDASPKIDALFLTRNLSQHLKTLRSMHMHHAQQLNLLHIEELLSSGLILEAQKALKEIDLPSFNNAAINTLTVVSQQLELIIQKTPKEKQERASLSALKYTVGDINEQVKLYNASKSTSSKFITHANMLFTLANFSANTETRHEAFTQLFAFLKTLQEKPGLYAAYRDSIKDNPQKLAFFNLMEKLSNIPNVENRALMFANYFLNPHLSEKEAALAAPLLLTHLNMEYVLGNLNILLDSIPENMKVQIAKTATQLFSQMIRADKLGQNIPSHILSSSHFEQFLEKLPEKFAFQTRLALQGAMEAPARSQQNIDNIIAIPISKKFAFSIEGFLKEELPTLDPKNPRYQAIVANVADSLFLTHASLFLRLRPGDFHKTFWLKKPEESQIRKITDSSNNITEFVVSQIKDAPDLATKRKIAMFFADLVTHIVQQDSPDFHSAASIIWGLARIPDKWLALDDPKFSKQFETAQKAAAFLKELNFTKYRKIEHDFRAEEKIHIPLFMAMVSDLAKLDENIDRAFSFWLQAKGRHYQYINGLQEQLISYFKTKPVMTVDVSKMAVAIGVSSAPAALETAHLQAPSVQSAPAAIATTTTKTASVEGVPPSRARARRIVLPSLERESRTPHLSGTESTPASFIKAKAPTKRQSGERSEPLLSQARTKPAGVHREESKAKTKVSSHDDTRDRRRAGVQNWNQMLKEEREESPQGSPKEADNPLVSGRSSKKSSGPKK